MVSSSLGDELTDEADYRENYENQDDSISMNDLMTSLNETDHDHHHIVMLNETIFDKTDVDYSKMGIEPPLWKRCHNDKLEDALSLKDYLSALEWLKLNNVNEAWLIYESFNKSGNMNLFDVLPQQARLHVKDLKAYLNEAFGLNSQQKRDLLLKMKKSSNESVIEFWHKVANFVYYVYNVDPVDISELEMEKHKPLKEQISFSFSTGLPGKWRLLLNIKSRNMSMAEILTYATDIEAEMLISEQQEASKIMLVENDSSSTSQSSSDSSTDGSSDASEDESNRARDEKRYRERECYDDRGIELRPKSRKRDEREREEEKERRWRKGEMQFCKYCNKHRLHESNECWFK